MKTQETILNEAIVKLQVALSNQSIAAYDAAEKMVENIDLSKVNEQLVNRYQELSTRCYMLLSMHV